MRFHGGAGLPAGEAQRSGAGGWEWTLPETFSWYTPELRGLLLMLTGVGWTDRACIKCSAWSDHVFWRRNFVLFLLGTFTIESGKIDYLRSLTLCMCLCM